MSSFDFIIPLSFDALQEATSTRQYVVTNILIIQEVSRKFSGNLPTHFYYLSFINLIKLMLDFIIHIFNVLYIYIYIK